MGVQTKMLEGDGNYGFDRSSAVRVVASKLASTDESEVRAAIEGIGRIGGDEARTQLTVFVETNQNRPQKTAEVRLARTTLESIKKNQTKKQ
jgi:hypothetical protein